MRRDHRLPGIRRGLVRGAVTLAPGWLVVIGLTTLASAGNMTRDGSFEAIRKKPMDAAALAKLAKNGWTFAKKPSWLAHWGPNPNTGNTHFEVRADGGHAGQRYIRLAGKGGGHISSYHGRLELGPYTYRLWARGKGTVIAGFYKYGTDGHYGSETPIRWPVATDTWTCYRAIYPNIDGDLVSANLFVSGTGQVDIDDVVFAPATPAEQVYLSAWAVLQRRAALVLDKDVVKSGTLGAKRADVLRTAWDKAKTGARKRYVDLDDTQWTAVGKRVAELAAVLSSGKPILADEYNQAVALAAALRVAAGEKLPGFADKPGAASVDLDHVAGVRAPRPNAVTIVRVRPSKVLYGLNEQATAQVTVVNTTRKAQTGTLVLSEGWDVDSQRELQRKPAALRPRTRRTFKVQWNVGPIPYGRELRATFLQGKQTLDAWAEYCAVADEWFWVVNTVGWLREGPHDRTWFSLYGNHGMYFARMPCDFSYQAPYEATWYSGQARYKINRQQMIAQIRHYQRFGVKATGYMNMFFCAQAGFETMRRHPEWYVRNANGQPQLHRYYGGTVSPMGVAKPVGEDPGAWYIGSVDCHTTEPATYAARQAIAAAKMFGFDGVMWDGPMTVIPGYSYDGQPVHHGGDFQKQSHKAMRTFIETVTTELPKYKVWVNWGEVGTYRPETVEYFGSDTQRFYRTTLPLMKCVLLEMRGQLRPVSPSAHWRHNYDQFLLQRDSATQRLGVPCMNGWIWRALPGDKPGPARWAWVATNHYASLLCATQFHVCTFGMPSWRPFMQFWTRYSALVWGKDLKVIPDVEKSGAVAVKANRPVWWKRTVYRRRAGTSGGQDILVNLVNEPVTEKIVFERPDDPPAASGTRVRVRVPPGLVLDGAWALRPYDYGEAQQPVRQPLKSVPNAGSVEVTVPAFRYYSLVVFRFRPEGPTTR